MAAGRILSPEAVRNGTPGSPELFQKWIDNLNAALGASGYLFYEDFDFKPAAALTSSGVMGAFKWQIFAGSPAVNVDDYAPDASTLGFVSIKRNSGSGNTSCVGSTAQLAIGTADFYFAARAKVRARSVLDGVGFGFGIGLSNDVNGNGPWFTAGSNDTRWWYSETPSGPLTRGALAIADNTYVVFEMARIGGQLAWSLNGVLDSAKLSAVDYGVSRLVIVPSALGISAGTEIAAVDYVRLFIARPVAG